MEPFQTVVPYPRTNRVWGAAGAVDDSRFWKLPWMVSLAPFSRLLLRIQEFGPAVLRSATPSVPARVIGFCPANTAVEPLPSTTARTVSGPP